MSKEKQIEEIAKDLCQNTFCSLEEWNKCKLKVGEYCANCRCMAERLYNAGYRKQSENVIELPCKMGDTLYMPWEWNGQKGIACLTVTVIRCICGFGWSFETDFDTDDEDYYEAYNCGSFKLEDFGEIVFLTKEEAEAKLKGGAE